MGDNRPEKIILHHAKSVDRPNFDDFSGLCHFHTSWRHYQPGGAVIVTEAEARQLMADGAHGVVPPWDPPCGYHRVFERIPIVLPNADGIERADTRVVVHPGRPHSQNGAHCLGWNYKSLGYCVIGDFDLRPPDAETYHLLRLICWHDLCRHHGIRGPEDIELHRTFAPWKSCPGTQFDIDIVREGVARYLRRFNRDHLAYRRDQEERGG